MLRRRGRPLIESALNSPSDNPVGKRHGWFLPVVALLLGLLTILVGAGLALLGMGFANATACGTGAAAAFAGFTTCFAVRGLKRRNSWTLIGLVLMWTWLGVRVILDWPATASNTVVVLFLMPGVGVPLGVAWAILTLVFGGGLIWRTIALVRSGQASVHAVKERIALARLLRLAVQLVALVAITYWTPNVVWNLRGRQIAALTNQYAPAAAATSNPVQLGACSMVFLGYELTQHGTDSAKSQAERESKYEKALGDAAAELASIDASGAAYVRVGASGDQLIESKPDQERIDDRYMAMVRRTGRRVVLVDTQHPKALRNHKLDWPGFCRFQRQRIEYYERRYQPDVYFVVCEPLTCHQFAIAKDSQFSAAAWTTQLSEMCRLVKSIQPKTQTGICILVDPNHRPEWEVWSGMKTLPELDTLSVEIYTPEGFQQTEERLREFGHPREVGKAFWIAETYNGWALCGDRRWDQDAAWLDLSLRFAGHVEAGAVLVWTFGSFVPGGNFWDFGNGRLQKLWGDGARLSEVGHEFSRLANTKTHTSNSGTGR